jgi:hypothetical protein
MRRRIRVDLAALETALDYDSYEMRHYLDLESGEILVVTAEIAHALEEIYDHLYDDHGIRVVSLEDYLRQLRIPRWQKAMLLRADRIEWGYGERYLRVRWGAPGDELVVMRRFLPTVPDPLAREALWAALQEPGAYRRFKETLARHPTAQEAWYAFQDAARRQRVVAWLAARDIEADEEVNHGRD